MLEQLIFPISLVIGALLTLSSVKYLHILQLEGYSVRGLLGWLFGKGSDLLLITALLSCAELLAMSISPLGFISVAVASVTVYLICFLRGSKTKLKITKRMTRLIVILLIVNVALSMLSLKLSAFILALVFLFEWLAVCLSALIISPIEKQINRHFCTLAKQKLAALDPIKIAITGSYGKTTAKNILHAMLSQKYKVCATPKSYNTPQGVSYAINRELSKDDRIFIVEMGARRVGDIAELTKMVMPDVAVITAVGNQHLGTFKSEQNIIKAKYELIEHLPCGGSAYFNGDNSVCRQYYDGYAGNKFLSGKGGSVYYDNVVMSSRGLSFDLHYGGKVEKMTTSLLGKHVPSMICLCAAVALNFSVPINCIKKAVNDLQPVAHRLQMIYNVNDVIIDDSYNSNEQGFISALEVLSYFSYLTKVLITPGVVELGAEQRNVNLSLGKRAGRVCDYVIALGDNAAALKEGALQAGLSPRRIYVAKDMQDALGFYKTILGGKAVLFENDLPDNY